MKLQDLLQQTGILIDFEAGDKTDTLRRLGYFIASLYDIADAEMVVQRLLKREQDVSTGIGYGIAIPHARLETIDRIYLIAARLSEPIDFESVDDQPVDLIFMMLSAANTSADHPAVLSALSRIMSYEEVRDRLRTAQDANSFLHILTKGENTYVG